MHMRMCMLCMYVLVHACDNWSACLEVRENPHACAEDEKMYGKINEECLAPAGNTGRCVSVCVCVCVCV